MATVRNQLVEVIDRLPEQEQTLLFEIALRFAPDDVATPDDLDAINTARKEYANGETVPHDVVWN